MGVRRNPRRRPWQNAWIESFNGRLRDELLTSWQFDSLLEVRVIIEDWRCDYNANRPHSAHGELPQPNSPHSEPRPTNSKPHSDWTAKRPTITLAGSRERGHRHG